MKLVRLPSLSIAALAAAFAAAAPASAESPAPTATIVGPMIPLPMLGAKIVLSCSNPGTHQDVAKTPIIRNNTTGVVPKGTTIQWFASDGDKGNVTLQSDLAPNATVSGLGKAGQVYSCSASFWATKPDLTVSKAQWVGSNSLSVQVKNASPWIDAGASVTKVEVLPCSGSGPGQTFLVPTAAVAKGSTVDLVVPAKLLAKNYLRITADSGLKIAESNEQNNVWDQINSCIQ